MMQEAEGPYLDQEENQEEEERTYPEDEEVIEPEERDFVAMATGEDYTIEARRGEGMTHLARRALKMMEEDQEISGLTDEHRIYIEDYVQRRVGGHWLEEGEMITISGELLEEAVSKSLELEEKELENLKQYSVLVFS